MLRLDLYGQTMPCSCSCCVCVTCFCSASGVVSNFVETVDLMKSIGRWVVQTCSIGEDILDSGYFISKFGWFRARSDIWEIWRFWGRLDGYWEEVNSYMLKVTLSRRKLPRSQKFHGATTTFENVRCTIQGLRPSDSQTLRLYSFLILSEYATFVIPLKRCGVIPMRYDRPALCHSPLS